MDIHTDVLPMFGYTIIRQQGERDDAWLKRCQKGQENYDRGTNYALAVQATTDEGVVIYRAGFRRDNVRDFCGGVLISSCFITYSQPGSGFNTRYKLESCSVTAVPSLNEMCGESQLRHKDVMEFLRRTLSVGTLSAAAQNTRTTIMWADKEGGETGKIMALLEDDTFRIPFGVAQMIRCAVDPDESRVLERGVSNRPMYMVPVTIRSIESDGVVNRNSGNTCRGGIIHIEWANSDVPGSEARCDNCGYYQCSENTECEDCGYEMEVPQAKAVPCMIPTQYMDAITTPAYLRALPHDEWKNG